MANWSCEDLMNLDLNLGPVGPTTQDDGPETEPSLGESLDVDRLMILSQRTRQQRLRWRQLQLAVESDGNESGFGVGAGSGEDGGGPSQVGEGSVATEERSPEVVKTCEHNVASLEGDSVKEEENVERVCSEGGSFFDCNICLDLSKDPVVTCCGHLFCWSCIYRWLHIHSDSKECPVCKGEVTLKNVTPIYGRGNYTYEPEEDSGEKIPARPSGKRVESLRQTIQRTASLFPMEEMIRRLGARFELTRDFFHLPGGEGDSEASTRASLLNRIMTTRALQRERSSAASSENVVDLTQDRPEAVPRRLPPLTYRRGQSHRSGSGGTSLERFVEASLRRSPPIRSQEMQPSSLDDRDSFSSIAAVIHGESQTVATSVESDSLVSHSTSSSRRRLDAPRGSDMDSGDSRVSRRRRLN
ncbi:uncharacterized protein LOC141642197 [Silene latifolia]|uniref:uncharacterized protein LOC141642197 n=1 Tax=Silene latifolia TaxID=37657 RepID=UPI003D77B927